MQRVGYKGKLRAGRTIRIPNNGDEVLEPVAEASREASPDATSKSAPPARAKKKAAAPARTHKVKPGQTLSGIAAQYNVSIAVLKRENDLPKSGAIRIGMKLRIPG